MNKKKIVSIDERIPKLKQMRKKKTNRRLIFYLSIFFILISTIVYLQSPLSDVKSIHINGNSYMTEEEIIKQSSLDEATNIWTINKAKIEQKLSENKVIKSVEMKKKLPRAIEINLTEHAHVGYIEEDNNFYPILSNGEKLNPLVNAHHGDAPLIVGFTDEDDLDDMLKELSDLPKSIMNLISEIHWTPNVAYNNKIILYMNDGFVVNGTAKDFANKMQVYPSIVAQLDPHSKGIIHIGVGAYFEQFD